MDDDVEMTEPFKSKYSEERRKQLGFKPQKELFCNKYLPYADQLDEESNRFLASIKENFAKAVAMREMNPGIGIYATRLHIYIKLYGLKFTKEDHVKFIKLILELLTTPFLEPAKINKLCKVLTSLLKKSQWLSPDDLQIDWRPLYELSIIYLNKNVSKGDLYRYFPSLEANLQYVISQCAIYFPKSATQEILDEIFPKLQPLDTGKNCNVFEILGIFLGAMVHGHELWLKHFIEIWDTYQNPPWSPDIMMLISCAAVSTIGKIDWEPYIPTIFTRILRSIDLPVSYKGLKSSRNPQMYTGAIASWIVAVLGPKSSAQKYLNKFMSTIESYLHPANSGKWVMYLSEILVSLLRTFFDRLICERYKKHPWKDPVPPEYCLTEKCITEFVECIKPVALQAMFSKMNTNDICKIFKHLADLRPELIIPEVIERVYATMDSLTEPHKMTAALQCLLSVARALVSDKKYTEGRTHIIPIFFAMLPGIDPNDIRKTSVTLQFLTSFALSIPIVDCSKAYQYYPDLTEEERLLCEQTADLEDFALQFLDRIFVLIEASATESTRLDETDHLKSRFDVFSEGLVQASSHAIFGQCSDEITLAAAKKLANFVKTHLLESRVSGPLLGSLVRIFSRVCASEFLRILVPYLTDQIQQYFDEHDDLPQLDKQRDEILYYLTMLLNVVRGDPLIVIKYVDTILPITDYVFGFKCKTANRLACTIISNLLNNLTTLQTMDIKSSPDCFTKPLNECLPIRRWGEKMKPDSKINWYIPDENVRSVCEKILHHHLLPILDAFKAHISDEKPMNRDDLLKNLEMVTGLLRCGNLLPNWDNEEPLQLYNSVVDRVHIDVALGFYHHHIKMPDGSNVRLAIIDVIHELQEKILTTSEDDSKSLRQILMLWEKVALRKHSNSSFDVQLKNYNITKQMQDFRLTKYKRDYRAVVITRVIMQQDCRDELNIPLLTASHKKIIINMLRLSCSHYSAVRSLAQAKLNNMLTIFPFSYRVIMDELITYLNVDTNEHHEKFKGALYVLGSNRRARLVVKHDWECIERLWPALLKSKMSEKPSVIKLLDFIRETIHNEFPTLSTKIEISDKAVQYALELVPEGYVSQDQIEQGKLQLEQTGAKNIETYQRIINNILEIINTSNLHWRYSLLASSMVYNLVHPLTNYPVEVAKHFVNNLIHESIQERKCAVRIINYVIRQFKRKQVKIEVDPFQIAGVPRPSEPCLLKPGNRPDNEWLQYDSALVPKNQSDWDQPRFLYKTNGYFGWTPKVQMYAPTADQPNLERTVDEMSEVERVIFEFFSNQANVDKLIEYWSLEEKKGKDKFNRSRFYLIKCLCNLYGDMLVPQLTLHLERLIDDKSNESNHRCAAEILAGLMRGAKHWPYDKTDALYKKIGPLIKMALNKITVESDVYWGTCFATAAEHMDPYRQWWLHELLLEEPLKDTTSFIDSSRLYCLQGAYNQHVWRMNSVSKRLLTYLTPYLDHSFQNIRERIGSILINIFEADLQFRDGPEPESPRVGKMIEGLMPRFEVLLKEKPKELTMGTEKMEVDEDKSTVRVDTEYDVSVRLFKTVCQWLIGVINRCTNGNEIPYFSLLPMACRLEKSESDTELVYICTSLIAMISQALTLPTQIDAVLDKITEISLSSSWSARLAVVDLLQVLVFHNMAIFLSRDDWIEKVQAIVLRLLEDNVLEVREKASEVLCGMLHCSFLTTTDKLLELFKKKCKTKITIKRGRGIATSSCSIEANLESRESDAVRIRHTGVLGLCAFISAYPYDVPEFVPNVFEHLGAHLNDPQPIPSTIRKTMGDFKRTHHDNWEQHQLKFTEDQLAVLSDLTVPPSYYA
uniref:CSON009560 protein n=1 Tax=Culicoides sonorensis TaxID=179676 RepID=A0A336KJE2_CULSO